MLVLTRKIGEAIRIGDDVRISIERIEGGQIRVGIEAPKEVLVLREELVSGEGTKPNSGQ